MKKWLILFLPIALFSNDIHSKFSDDNPALVANVNVVSGHLNLPSQTITVEGPLPLSIPRHYSSSGALTLDMDTKIQSQRRGWMILGGWDLLPHTNCLLEVRKNSPHPDHEAYKIYVAQSSGNLITYDYASRKGHSTWSHVFKPRKAAFRMSGKLSATTQTLNNSFLFDKKGPLQYLSTPDGGKKTYKGRALTDYAGMPTFYSRPYFYQLVEEELPSGHIIFYHYEGGDDRDLKRMELCSPDRKKVFSYIDFSYERDGHILKKLSVKTSDGKEATFFMTRWCDTYYLTQMSSNCLSSEDYVYTLFPHRPGRPISQVILNGIDSLRIGYYKEGDSVDKVHTVARPVGPNNEMVTVATFTYSPRLTTVVDGLGIITKYYHDGERLIKVEYYDSQGKRHSSQMFYWQETNLVCKALLDDRDNPVFAKTFKYDTLGNVLEEGIWGTLTGHETTPLVISEEGCASGAENYRKSYAYLPNFNVVTHEVEDNGLSYRYTYLPKTDLLRSKLTYYEGKIVLRSFCNYDIDHLLISEIEDDGSSPLEDNLENINLRKIKRYDRDPQSGLITTISELYFDKTSHSEKLARKTKLTYSEQSQVIKEDIYDADGIYRYSLHTTYDTAGRVLSKTTPMGQVNSYTYDGFGQLQSSKEVGSAVKQFSYDAMGRNHKYEIAGKLFHTAYDIKGRAVSETDAKGNVIDHEFDDFGHIIKTKFPQTQDEQGFVYTPEVRFAYDIQGNLAATTLPRGETTKTWYNVWRKPIRIVKSDHSGIRHYYNRQGLLQRTIHEDGSEELLSYDVFEHLISKKLYSAEGKLLLSEEWNYSPAYLLSYKDPRGLVTIYEYDGRGRKISESSEDRKINYTYNSLGELEKTSIGALSHFEIKNASGLIVEQWEIDAENHEENHMYFSYDSENRKSSALRITSQGKATDVFYYDEENRLIKHVDPLQAVTEFHYENIINDLGQYVLQKTTIDPLGNRSQETYDVGDRLVSVEKFTPHREIVAREMLFYDRSGNKAKRISTAFADGSFVRDSIVIWDYDARGRIKLQTENGQKVTKYDYDVCDRLIRKTLPSDIVITNTYDAADRLLSTKSSDGSIWHAYIYEGPDIVKMIDHVENNTWNRSYNRFGDLISEENPQFPISWEYDLLSRKTFFALPDSSSVRYFYEGAHMKRVERISASGQLQYQHVYKLFDVNGRVQSEELILAVGSLETIHDLLERPLHQKSPWHSHQLDYSISGLVVKVSNTLFEDKICSYDALRQLKQEGSHNYNFDSLGNPSDCQVNEYNQITASSEGAISYDEDGNLLERTIEGQKIQYRYDAQSRLKEIIYPDSHRITYAYDPLSRLFSKTTYVNQEGAWIKESKRFFIYDQDKEVGTLDEDLNIMEFKVLGLGIRGDIGAAIALELKGQTYAPLHDFMGNIIGLVNSQGSLIESYNISAFGREEFEETPLNPWRFASKRSEEGLVFFGLRFYDPHLGRWLTPDPAGYIDGPNLYAYVGNSPLNRLDLFGLWQEDSYDPCALVHGLLGNCRMMINIQDIPKQAGMVALLCRASAYSQFVDLTLFCGHLHELKFGPDEYAKGYFNFFDHYRGLVDTTGSSISLCVFGNGIYNYHKDFSRSVGDISKDIGGTLVIGIYNPTQGVTADCCGFLSEKYLHIESSMTKTTRQIIRTIATSLYNINRNTGWVYFTHSRDGLTLKRGIEGLGPESQEIIHQNLYIYAQAPGEPIPNSYAKEVINVCSEKDNITKRFAPSFKNCPNLGSLTYNYIWLKALSAANDRTFTIEHEFLGPTLSKARKDYIDILENKNGFYKGNTYVEIR